MSFAASAVINESFGSHHGQLFHLRLCKTEGKYWSYLETRLAFYFFCYQWVRSSLGVWVLQIRTEAARTIIWEQHQQTKSRLLLCPFCSVWQSCFCSCTVNWIQEAEILWFFFFSSPPLGFSAEPVPSSQLRFTMQLHQIQGPNLGVLSRGEGQTGTGRFQLV